MALVSTLFAWARKGCQPGSPGATEQLLQEIHGQTAVLHEYLFGVLWLMVKGLSPDQIAEKPGRTKAAIYAAQRQIRDKLGVNSNEQSVVTAIRLKMVPLGDLVQ